MTVTCQHRASARPSEAAALIVPAYVQEWTEARLRARSDKAPNLTISQWLEAQPDRVRRRERLRLLGKLGLVCLKP